MATNDKCYFDPTTDFTSPNPGEDELATLKRILAGVQNLPISQTISVSSANRTISPGTQRVVLIP